MLAFSRNGRSEDVLPLPPPSRLKPRVRGVYDETMAPFLTGPAAAVGGNPGVRGIMPGAWKPDVMGIMPGDFMISSSNSFSMALSSRSSRIAARSSLVMKQEWTVTQNSTK